MGDRTYSEHHSSERSASTTSECQAKLRPWAACLIFVSLPSPRLELVFSWEDPELQSIGEELLLCQRYYCEVKYNIQGYPPSGGYADENMHWLVNMRASPSIVRSGGTLGGTGGIIGTQTYNINNIGCRAELQTNANFGRMYEFDGTMKASAEL